MINFDLKNKLLETCQFESNEYFEAYLDLINRNLDRVSEKYKTQKHHIFPVSLSKIIGSQIDNSKSNLVNLLYKDHILAHYYLSLCTRGEFKYKMICAIQFLSGHVVNYSNGAFDKNAIDTFLQSLDNYQLLREYYAKEQSIRNVGKKMSKESIEKGIQSRKKSAELRGYYISAESRKNLSEQQTGRICIKKGDKYKRIWQKELNQYLEDGWVLGARPCPDSLKQAFSNKTTNGHTGKIYINKDGKNKLISPDALDSFLLDGWIQGRLTSEKGIKNLMEAAKKRDYTKLKGIPKTAEHKKSLANANAGKVYFTKNDDMTWALPNSDKYFQLLENGWSIGGRDFTEDHKEKLSKVKLGKIWVTNGECLKLINPEALDSFIALGYHKGRK